MKKRRKFNARLKRNRHFRQFSLLRKRGYAIKGEDLPEETRKLSRIGLIGFFSVFIIVFLIGNYLIQSVSQFLPIFKEFFTSRFSLSVFEDAYERIQPFKVANIFDFNLTKIPFIVLVLFGFSAGTYIYLRLSYRFKKLSYGQKGDNRLATLEEIMEQYNEIPDKTDTFTGIGGVPISHYGDRYYIDTDTVNTCYLGVSRSGKGEMFVTVLIDILSRAMVKSSMVLNDPKGELYAASKETLEKRGFNVQVLNILDPMQSMSYNPLQLILDAWIQGDKATAQQLTNTLTYALYNDPNAGQNKFFNQAAQRAVNGIILALIEECEKTRNFEKVTLFNVGQMLNELGTMNWVDEETGQEKNGLDEYFKNLPQGNLAKTQYATTSFAGDKAKGSILATANEGLNIFQFETLGKMTSKNSFDLKSIGFPKTLKLRFAKEMLNKRMTVKFVSAKNNRILGVESIKPNLQGLVNLNFNYELETGDTIRMTYRSKGKKEEAIYQVNRERDSESKEFLRKVEMRMVLSTLTSLESVQMDYSDEPVAVFMITPDFDESMHVIASIFVKQLYTTLAQNASITRGKECFRRVQFILDEFGNMPPIEAMDSIMTVCLGRNILFNIIVQSYNQLKGMYGDTAGETIKENCQNHIYIMSGNSDTIKEISERVGRKTVEGKTSNDKQMELENSHNRSAEEEYLLTTERLSTLIEGETVVIRNLHRQDTNRRKIRPFPIFNTKETSMPYRWEFLSKDFDTNKDINSFDIPSMHTHLDLDALSINFSSWLDTDGIDLDIQEDLRTEQKTQVKLGELKSGILSILNKGNAPKERIEAFMSAINSEHHESLKQLSQEISDPEIQASIIAYVSALIDLQKEAA